MTKNHYLQSKSREKMQKSLLKVIALQASVLAFCCALSGVISLSFAGFFTLGALCVFLPHALLGVFLAYMAKYPATLQSMSLLLGVAVKIVFSVFALLASHLYFQQELLWLPFLIGVIVALKTHFLALFIPT
jgi:F0F1-type ATP synthase assembly protein I